MHVTNIVWENIISVLGKGQRKCNESLVLPGAFLAQSVEHAILDLGVMSSSLTLKSKLTFKEVPLTLKKKVLSGKDWTANLC